MLPETKNHATPPDLEQMIERYNRELRSLGRNSSTTTAPSPSLLEQIPSPEPEPLPEQTLPPQTGTGTPANQEYLAENHLAPPSPEHFTDSGTLLVIASVGQEALPLADADVFVSSVMGDQRILLAILRTDENGATPAISLPAPDRELANVPGNPSPFALYDVLVDHPQYYVEVRKNVQIFGGITSDLLVNMIPAAEPVYPSNDSNLTVLEQTQVSVTDRSPQTEKG